MSAPRPAWFQPDAFALDGQQPSLLPESAAPQTGPFQPGAFQAGAFQGAAGGPAGPFAFQPGAFQPGAFELYAGRLAAPILPPPRPILPGPPAVIGGGGGGIGWKKNAPAVDTLTPDDEEFETAELIRYQNELIITWLTSTVACGALNA